MPNPLMMRWMVGTAIVLAVALAVAIGWRSAPSGTSRVSGSPGVSDQSELARRQDELLFLKAAFDRLNAEARQDPNGPAFRSLRAEQDAVVLRMREVARPLPAESLPPALRALAKDEPHTAPEPTFPAAGPAQASGTPATTQKLKVGLGSPSSRALDLALSRDPGLNFVILVARPRPPRPASESPADSPAEPQAATADATKAAKTRAAERAAAHKSAAGAAGFSEPPRSEPATAAR